MQGSTFLKVMGILMIIFGAIALVMGIIALAGVGVILAYAGVEGTLFAGLFTFASVLVLLGAAMELIAGILGVKNWNRPERAGVCVGWGVAILVLCILSNLSTIISSANIPGAAVNYFSVLLGLVMPVLYLVAAVQCKNMAR